MKRFALIMLLMFVVVLTGAGWVLAKGDGALHAEQAKYVIGETQSTLTLDGGVTFDYNGYSFSADSVELILEKPEQEDVETDLKSATFHTDVHVTTPSGGRLFADTLTLIRSGSNYIFSGGMTYIEGRLKLSGGKLRMNSSGNSITASGGVTAIYMSAGGFRGMDGTDYEVVFTGDTLIYDRSSGTLKSGGGGAHFVYDDFVIDAGNLTIEIMPDNQIGLAALDSVSIHGRGIVVNGLNASYNPSSGELKIWDQVVYRRSGDTFKADEVIWYVREENDRMSVKGGEATIDLTDDVETDNEPVDNGNDN